MKIKCKMLVDFDNPLSMEYSEISLRSFEPLDDILDIELVQCFKPDTLPDNWARMGHWRSFQYLNNNGIVAEAIFSSHLNLLRSQEDERIIVMEHDAYIYPDRVDILRELLNDIDSYDIWMPGACMEFYSLSTHMIDKVVDFLNNYSTFDSLLGIDAPIGPYGILSFINSNPALLDSDRTYKYLSATKGNKTIDATVSSRNFKNVVRGEVVESEDFMIKPPCVKQLLFADREYYHTNDLTYPLYESAITDKPDQYLWIRDFALIYER